MAQSSAGQAVQANERRAGEDAVAAAQDAFGVAIGREQLGLYESGDVRGFSPIAAGNARIEGLYFDPVAEPNARLAATTTIRVGISAQGAPLIAPTGIVDYGFRLPGDARAASLLGSGDGWGSASIEADGGLPIGSNGLSLGLGGQIGRQEFGDGTREAIRNLAFILRWRPASGTDAVGFWSRAQVRDAIPSPISLAGESLPVLGFQRRFDGPDWARIGQTEQLGGLILKRELAPGLYAAVGAFHSHRSRPVGFSLLRSEFTDESFRQLVVAEPPQRTTSNSGEVRLTRSFGGAPQLHQLHLSLRVRDRTQSFGGGETVDLGRFELGRPIIAQRPDFSFGLRAFDMVRQSSLGIAYEGRLGRIATLGIGLQRSNYRKRSLQPGVPLVASHAKPWLLSAAGTMHATSELSFYTSYAEGLEESEPAPDNAVNRGQPVPVTNTRQIDAGLRWRPFPSISVIAGVFQLEKPYFSLDADNRYVRLGAIRNRGLELSFTGALTPRLNVVAGTLLQRPRVVGPAVDDGLIGRRPVGLLTRISTLDIDWRTPVPDVSLDLSVGSRSREVSTPDNRIWIPARTLLSLGGRYRFRIADNDAVFRVTIDNLTDRRGYASRGPGAYVPLEGRLVSGYLTVDF